MSTGIAQAAGQVAATIVVEGAQAAGNVAFTKAKLATAELASSDGVRRGLRAGRGTLLLAIKAITISFGATTTLVAGYLAGIGIDFIPLVDKFSIASSILLYTSITAALVSPLLVIPHTALAVRDHRRRELRERLGNLELEKGKIATRREQLVAEARAIKARLEADHATTTNRSLRQRLSWAWNPAPSSRPQDEIASDKAENERLQLEIGGEELKENSIQGEQKQIQQELAQLTSSVWSVRLRAICYLFYVIVGAVLLLGVLPTVAAVYFTVAAIALYFFAKRTSFEIAAPMASVHLLAFGLLLGLEAYNLPPNANLRVGEDDYPVRVLVTTSNGYVAIGALTKSGTERQLSFVPRESVTRISALKPPLLIAWYQRLPALNLSEALGVQAK